MSLPVPDRFSRKLFAKSGGGLGAVAQPPQHHVVVDG